ncbi:IclR family transcriptional regulator [Nocardioides ferulae]|uniref:IclR family transcriptional regulator n=1 Tax=Nocardioides ferulae TaxID=2340821 RepID=UPI000EAE4A6E|nr:IclR family transcriptional regulator [Nocardioides ferulae]
MTTLVSRGLVSRSAETARYRLGMRLYELGQLAMTRNHLRTMALPTLVQLRHASGLTVQLAIPDGADVVYAERLETNLGVALLRRTGRRLPAHTTSSGKAIAAFNPSFAEARRAAGFPARTAFTLTTVEQWEERLAETRRQHGAISFDEATVGVGSCAAPLHGPSGEAIAGVSLVGPTESFRAQGGHLLSLVVAAAAKLSRSAPPSP